MRYLRTNTATRITVGPFLDKTDGITPETSLTVTSCKLTLMIDDAGVPTLVLDTAPTASGGANDMFHVTGDDSGFYDLELAAANVNYLGRAMLAITDAATHCPVFHEFMIVPATVYDSLFLGTDTLPVDTIQLGGDTQSATDLKDFADAGYDPATNKVQGVVLVDTVTAATLANGAHGGSSMTLTFQKIVGASSGNDPCITITGSGTGEGILVNGGATGSGIEVNAGVGGNAGIYLSGYNFGLYAKATYTTGIGICGRADGLGPGIKGDSNTGYGMHLTGNSSATALYLAGAFSSTHASNDIRGVQADAVKISGSTDAADNLELSAETIVVCTASGVPTTTSIPTSACTPAGSALDQFKGRIIIFRNDTATVALRGQATEITGSSASATPTFTVTALTTAPSSGDTFVIV